MQKKEHKTLTTQLQEKQKKCKAARSLSQSKQRFPIILRQTMKNNSCLSIQKKRCEVKQTIKFG